MSTLKIIYFIRHGQTSWNTEGRFQGKTDTPLSEKGRKQAEALAKRLENTRLDIVYSSPLRRAMETAAPLANRRGLHVIGREELREIDFGRWEGLTLKEIAEAFPEEFEKCRTDPFTHGFRFGMPYADVWQTASAFLEEYVHNREHERIAVVAHAAIIKMLLSVLLDLPPGLLHSIILKNCSVSVIKTGEERNYILKLNDTGELI